MRYYYCAHYGEEETEAYSDYLAKVTQPARGRAKTKPTWYLPASLSTCLTTPLCISFLLRMLPLYHTWVFGSQPEFARTALSSHDPCLRSTSPTPSSWAEGRESLCISPCVSAPISYWLSSPRVLLHKYLSNLSPQFPLSWVRTSPSYRHFSIVC